MEADDMVSPAKASTNTMQSAVGWVWRARLAAQHGAKAAQYANSDPSRADQEDEPATRRV